MRTIEISRPRFACIDPDELYSLGRGVSAPTRGEEVRVTYGTSRYVRCIVTQVAIASDGWAVRVQPIVEPIPDDNLAALKHSLEVLAREVAAQNARLNDLSKNETSFAAKASQLDEIALLLSHAGMLHVGQRVVDAVRRAVFIR